MNTTDQRTGSIAFREHQFDSHFFRKVPTKVVVQDIPSGLYLSEGDFWAVDVENARSFESSATALEAATELNLKSVQIEPAHE